MSEQDSAGAPNRRRRRYLDGPIQRRLILGLTAVQLLALVAALLYLHEELRQAIQANLYRVHLLPGDDLLRLLDAVGRAALGLVLVNAVLLVAADRLWSRYVGGVIHGFRRLVAASGQLDFRPDPGPVDNHELIAITLQWRERERRLCRQLRERLQQAAGRDPADPVQRRELVADLRALAELVGDRVAGRPSACQG